MSRFTIDIGKINTTMARAIDVGVLACGNHVKNTISSSMASNSKGRSSAPGTPPNRQTGNLSRSIQPHLVATGVVRVGANERYARIHEMGGVIRPKRAKYLWIPVNAKPSETPSAVISHKKDYAFIPRRSGGFFVVKKSKSGRKLKAGMIYVLSLGVYLAKRPYMAPGLAKAAPDLPRIFSQAARKAFGVA